MSSPGTTVSAPAVHPDAAWLRELAAVLDDAPRSGAGPDTPEGTVTFSATLGEQVISRLGTIAALIDAQVTNHRALADNPMQRGVCGCPFCSRSRTA